MRNMFSSPACKSDGRPDCCVPYVLHGLRSCDVASRIPAEGNGAKGKGRGRGKGKGKGKGKGRGKSSKAGAGAVSECSSIFFSGCIAEEPVPKSDKGLEKRIQKPWPEKVNMGTLLLLSCGARACHARYARGDVALQEVVSGKDKKLSGQDCTRFARRDSNHTHPVYTHGPPLATGR